MAQCEANTKNGRRCHNSARVNKRFCAVHAETLDWRSLAITAVGAVAGNVILPGLGGILAGGGAGYFISTSSTEDPMKKRVFISFDFDNDRTLKEFIIAQSKNADSPFEVIDHSLREAAPERDWKTKARAAISRSEIVLVMVGPKTHRAAGVLAEVQMARDLGKRIVQVIGYRDGNYTAVPNAGRLYRWNWPNLKMILS